MRGELESWRVGKALAPEPEDKRYGDEYAAIDKAAKMANAYGWYVPIAVWDSSGDIVHLFAMGQQFRKV